MADDAHRRHAHACGARSRSTSADPRLRQLFGRYATYNGSSPYHAPATLAVIAHVENAYGIFAVAGRHRAAGRGAAPARRASSASSSTCNAEVDEIVVEPSGGPLATALRARGVRVNGAVEWADCVIANCDVATSYGRLLAQRAAKKPLRKYDDEELSLSAYVLLGGRSAAPMELLHHNVFFSRDYKREFEELVDERRPPEDPTVYVCAEAPVDERQQRYFILTNAPPLDERGARIDWSVEASRCRERIERVLRATAGRSRRRRRTRSRRPTSPRAFRRAAARIYGLASNSTMAAFKRPAEHAAGNRRALFGCGGTRASRRGAADGRALLGENGDPAGAARS